MGRQTREYLSDAHSRGLFGNQRLLVTPEKLHLACELREAIYQWPLVAGISTADTHVFILVGSAAAVVIPMAAFDSAGARDQFVEKARAYQAAAAAEASDVGA